MVSTAEAAPGEEVTLTVSMKNNPGIASFGLNIEYDKDVLSWTGVTKGSISSGTWDVGVDETETWFDFENFTDDVVILTLTFTVADNAPAGTSVVTLTYDPDNVCDEDLENVTFAVSAVGVTVTDSDEHIHTMTLPAVPAFFTEMGNRVHYHSTSVDITSVTLDTMTNSKRFPGLSSFPGILPATR